MFERFRITSRIIVALAAIALSPGQRFAMSPDDSAAAHTQSLQRYEFVQIHMGVPFTLVLYAPGEEAANAASDAAFARVKQLNMVLSDYDPDSEAMRLCRSSGPEQAVKVSEELFFVLSRSIDVSKETEGAFDVTVGPVVKLWRKARRTRRLPEPAALADALSRVGYQAVQLDPEQRTVRLTKPGMLLDFGGIAKGYAADEALRVLKAHGIPRALVAASGDIVAGDPPPDRAGWRVEVAAVEPASREPGQSKCPGHLKCPGHSPEPKPRFLLLSNAAVSTSGDAYQFVEIGGTRYSHIVDPKTGLGLTAPMSVTVVAPRGVTSDSWASAVSVLGAQRGMKLIESQDGMAAFVALFEDGEIHTIQSRSFGEYVEPAN